MPTSFQEFLQKKANTDWKERRSRREEWIGAVERLYEKIREWLRESDPEGLIEVMPYKAVRVEERLGLYDAPALELRLGTDSINILPAGRHVPLNLLIQNLQAVRTNERRWGDLSGGRVDVTDGERRYQLLRSVEDGQDHWYVWGDKLPPESFDRVQLEVILEDLLG